MKYADLPTDNHQRSIVTRKALQPLCEAVGCHISTEWMDQAIISIRDWRCTRKWHVLIDSSAKNMKALYNKTLVYESDDFDVICQEIIKHNENLAKRYDKIKMDRALKDGDIIPIIMEMIREKAPNGARIMVDSDTAMSMHYDHTGPSSQTTGVSVYIRFDKETIEVRTSSQLGGTTLIFALANPSFSPERWVDWMMKRVIETSIYIDEASKKYQGIWTQTWPHGSMAVRKDAI